MLDLKYHLAKMVLLRFTYISAGHIAIVAAFTFFALVSNSSAQIDEICSDVGVIPSLDSPFAHVPYVYGRIVLKGFDSASKSPKVTVIFSEDQRPPTRLLLERSGNYCFKRSSGTGTLVVEVDGLEVARRTLVSIGTGSQQREDFEIYPNNVQRKPPATISAKFARQPNARTVELYRKTAEAENSKDLDSAIKYLKDIVAVDPEDFIAWAKLGTDYFARDSYAEADAAYRKCLELRTDYTPAWINVGKLRMAQKQFEAAIEILKYAITLDDPSAMTYRLLGEAYLQARHGTLGAEALNQAIKLDPIGMAECHLLLARLYDLAGAKNLASREYKLFLTTVPDHPDKKKFERYIQENPETP